MSAASINDVFTRGEVRKTLCCCQGTQAAVKVITTQAEISTSQHLVTTTL